MTVNREHWTEELRRYRKDKYESESILEESTVLLCRLESASRAANLEGRGPPRFDMAHLLQARASMNGGEATGLDRVAPEMIEALPWKALGINLWPRRSKTSLS